MFYLVTDDGAWLNRFALYNGLEFDFCSSPYGRPVLFDDYTSAYLCLSLINMTGIANDLRIKRFQCKISCGPGCPLKDA